jgi:hypothetical protein
MYAEILEYVMSVYRGEYDKTFAELEDSVKNLLSYYEGRLDILNKKKETEYNDIRIHNMRNSAYDSCRSTVKMLGVLDRDLKDPKQVAYFKKKHEDRINAPDKPINHKKSTSQIKLF